MGDLKLFYFNIGAMSLLLLLVLLAMIELKVFILGDGYKFIVSNVFCILFNF